MRKIIATMNMTIDGYCDHTAGVPDEDLHRHYTNVLNNAGAVLYGRKTYQLMEDYWPKLVNEPSGKASMDDFAMSIQKVPKVVFSNTLKSVEWENARLAKNDFENEVLALKQEAGNDIMLGSPGLIAEGTRLNLIDEFQLCVHPVIAGSGLVLFKNISNMITLKLVKTKNFDSGIVLHYYQPATKQ